MNLNPRPKPIRYRVSSGGVEHASLESLRSHFNWSEVKELIRSARIQEWLRKVDKSDIADSIDSAIKENASDWSIAALFFGLDGTLVDGWLSLVKYWYNQHFEHTIQLNLDEWANSNLKIEQLKNQLPSSLLMMMGDHQYKSVMSLPLEKQKKALERLASLGSSRAKHKLLVLKEESAREAKRQKQVAAEEAKRQAIDGLRNDWKSLKVREPENYAPYLQPAVSFLVGVQELLKFDNTKMGHLAVSDLARCIQRLEGEAIDNPNGEYYWCALLATYRYLFFSYAQLVVDSITISHLRYGGVTEAFKKDYIFSNMKGRIPLFIKKNTFLIHELESWDRGKTGEVHDYSAFAKLLRRIGDNLLDNTTFE